MKIEGTSKSLFPLTADDLVQGECYARFCDGALCYILVTDEDTFVILSGGVEYELDEEDEDTCYRHLPNATFRPEG